MPSSWHDSVTAVFTENPELALEIATSLNGTWVPRGIPVRAEAPDFGDHPSTDFQADAVIVAGTAGDPVRAVIVEAQKHTLKDRPVQWARYAAQLWTFLRCPVDVLVICPDAKSAFWYARPVVTTLPGYTHLPVVLPPSAVPAVISPDEVAARPAMAALSVAYHGANPAVCRAFADGLRQLPRDDAVKYHEHAFNMSPLAVRRILEQLMTSDTWPVYTPIAKEHFGRGKKEGEAEAILLVLKARSLDVSDAERERITSCTDLKQLKVWITRAATADKTSGLFN